MSDYVTADWCATYGDAIICGTRLVEHSRDSQGIRWCFTCRKRHEFWRVVSVPDGPSYYGPTVDMEGVTPECSDLFPGWSRDWSER